MNRDVAYLHYIRECIERIERFTAGGEVEFRSNEMVRDAVLRNVQTLLETAKRISAERKQRHPDVDWAGMAGFRNVLVHDYLDLELAEVWRILQSDLPPLKAAIEAMIAEL